VNSARYPLPQAEPLADHARVLRVACMRRLAVPRVEIVLDPSSGCVSRACAELVVASTGNAVAVGCAVVVDRAELPFAEVRRAAIKVHRAGAARCARLSRADVADATLDIWIGSPTEDRTEIRRDGSRAILCRSTGSASINLKGRIWHCTACR